MSRHIQVAFAIVRKDFLQLWPLAGLAVALLFLRNLLPDTSSPPAPQLAALATLAMCLACGALVIATLQQDAPASARHDWLTRPIPGASALIAKVLFICAALAVPAMLGGMIHALIEDRTLGEAVANGTDLSLLWIGVFLAVAAAAAITTTLLQTAGVLALGIAFSLIVSLLMIRISSGGDARILMGIGWIPASFYLLVVVTASVIVLWLQYTRRATKVSRVTFAATVVILSIAPSLFTWSTTFAIQKALSSSRIGADELQLGLAPGCFARVSESPIQRQRLATPLKAPAPDAIDFVTTLESKVPPGWRVSVGNVKATYLSDDGKALQSPALAGVNPAATTSEDGKGSSSNAWILSRAAFNSLLTQRVRLNLVYSLSVLEPFASASISTNGERRYFPELGYCSASTDSVTGTVSVSCYKRGAQPALLSATAPGVALTDDRSYPQYRPALMELLSTENHQIRLRLPENVSSTPSVTVTAYRARGHVDREVTAAGILGGEQCKL
jgi:hypothetical protein